MTEDPQARDSPEQQLRRLRPVDGWAASEPGRRTLERVQRSAGPSRRRTGRASRPRLQAPAVALLVASLVVVAGVVGVTLHQRRPVEALPPAAAPSSTRTVPAAKLGPAKGPTLSPIDVDPDSPRRIVYDADLLSDPLPTPAPVPRTSRAAAVTIARTHRLGPSPQTSPLATLRMVTVSRGAASSAAVPRLSWVLSWHVIGMADTGPPGLSPAKRKQRAYEAAHARCLYLAVIDATTGRSIPFTESRCVAPRSR